jgi:hypothetical protein
MYEFSKVLNFHIADKIQLRRIKFNERRYIAINADISQLQPQ